METLIQELNSMSPFMQGLAGSAVFAASTLIARFIWAALAKNGKSAFRSISKVDMIRHFIFKEYVSSYEPERAIYGFAFISFFALRWTIKGLLIATFFVGVHSIIQSNWLFVAASWFCLNCFLEAHTWTKNFGNEQSITHVSPDVRHEVMSMFHPKAEQVDKREDTL